MSRDLGRDVPDLEKLYARKLWADFSYPSLVLCKAQLGEPFLGIWIFFIFHRFSFFHLSSYSFIIFSPFLETGT